MRKDQTQAHGAHETVYPFFTAFTRESYLAPDGDAYIKYLAPFDAPLLRKYGIIDHPGFASSVMIAWGIGAAGRLSTGTMTDAAGRLSIV